MSASSNKSAPPASTSTASAAPNNTDIDKILSREAAALQRDVEVERILKAFKLNPYDILGLTQTATADDIRKKFRQVSLFIHPDKCSHPKAPEAFDLLKKAEAELSIKEKREELDAVVKQARLLVLKSLNLPLTSEDSDEKLKDLNPSFATLLNTQTKQLLIDEEVRRRRAVKLNLANEGLEAKKKEEEIAQRKRKAEDDKAWEESREERVGSWRNFAATSKKKKKAKTNILG